MVSLAIRFESYALADAPNNADTYHRRVRVAMSKQCETGLLESRIQQLEAELKNLRSDHPYSSEGRPVLFIANTAPHVVSRVPDVQRSQLETRNVAVNANTPSAVCQGSQPPNSSKNCNKSMACWRCGQIGHRHAQCTNDTGRNAQSMTPTV